MHATLKNLILLGFMLSTTFLSAQEQIGLRTDRFSGVEGLSLNPANNLTFPLTWDLNLGSAGLFFNNSIGYISETNVIDLIHNGDRIEEAIDLGKDVQPYGPLVAHLFNDNRDKFFSFKTSISGPGLAFHIKNNSFGVFSKVRFETNMQTLPGSVSYEKIYNTSFGDPIHLPKLDMAGMGWAEVGFNYARRIEISDGFLDVGANLKYLVGYQAFFISNNVDFDLAHNQDTISISSPDVTSGFTNEALDEDFMNNPRLNKNGSGFGFDVGINYVMPDDENGYKYKIGASLIDIGTIHFTSHSEQHQFSIDSTFVTNVKDYEQYDNSDDLTDAINQDFYGAVNTSQTDETFSVSTPAMLSIQFDYKIANLIYLHGMWNQRLVFGKTAIKRDNSIAFTPRLEHRWFTAMMPMVINNYTDFRTGLAFRIGYVTIGTDHVGSIFSKKNFTGTDFYVGMSVSPFKLKYDKKSKSRRGRSKGVSCYKF